jgi:ribosomal protein S18 acetylase RimI-like enzyme
VHVVSLEVRLAKISDAATVAALNYDVQKIHADAHPWRFKQPSQYSFTTAEAEALLADPTHFAFLAIHDGMPVGYIVAEIARRAETPRHHPHEMIYVHQLSVRPDARRKGVGRALLDATKAKGRSIGIDTLALDVWAFNEAAIEFFKGYGLAPFNVRMWNRLD